MFSEELAIMDRNTVHIMFEEMINKLAKQKEMLKKNESLILEQAKIISEKDHIIAQLQQQLAELSTSSNK